MVDETSYHPAILVVISSYNKWTETLSNTYFEVAVDYLDPWRFARTYKINQLQVEDSK